MCTWYITYILVPNFDSHKASCMFVIEEQKQMKTKWSNNPTQLKNVSFFHFQCVFDQNIQQHDCMVYKQNKTK